MKMEMKQLVFNLHLGEGCIWDEERNKIHFVDIEGFKIYSLEVDHGEIEEYDAGDYVGCIVLDQEGSIIAAVRNKLLRIDLKSKRAETILTIDQPEYMRFNDGKCDKFGNLWVGTMAIDQSHPKAVGAGKLYCISKGKIIAEYEGFTISNGLAWSGDGERFYHIDTKTQKIDVYEVEGPGIIKNKRTLVAIDSEEGSPDGMCMDSEGRLWVAMWGGSKVNSYDSYTGEKLGEISVPSVHTSCCTFGGESLDTFYITSAKDEEGNYGGLYEVRVPGVRGVKSYRYENG